MPAEVLSHRLTRIGRLCTILLVYSFGLSASLWLAYELRFDFALPSEESALLWKFGLWIIPLKLVLLLAIGQFSGLLSYFGIPDLRRLTLALALSSCVVAVT